MAILPDNCDPSSLDLDSINIVVTARIIIAHVHYFTYFYIEKQLPLSGP